MTPLQQERKSSLQRELIELRKALRNPWLVSSVRNSLHRRVNEISSELLTIDPNAALYKNWERKR